MCVSSLVAEKTTTTKIVIFFLNFFFVSHLLAVLRKNLHETNHKNKRKFKVIRCFCSGLKITYSPMFHSVTYNIFFLLFFILFLPSDASSSSSNLFFFCCCCSLAVLLSTKQFTSNSKYIYQYHINGCFIFNIWSLCLQIVFFVFVILLAKNKEKNTIDEKRIIRKTQRKSISDKNETAMISFKVVPLCADDIFVKSFFTARWQIAWKKNDVDGIIILLFLYRNWSLKECCTCFKFSICFPSFHNYNFFFHLSFCDSKYFLWWYFCVTVHPHHFICIGYCFFFFHRLFS